MLANLGYGDTNAWITSGLSTIRIGTKCLMKTIPDLYSWAYMKGYVAITGVANQRL